MSSLLPHANNAAIGKMKPAASEGLEFNSKPGPRGGLMMASVSKEESPLSHTALPL